MSGQLITSDISGKVIEKRRDHSKYIVKVAIHDDGERAPLVATAGWDCKIHIYSPKVPTEVSNGEFTLGEPTASITLQTKPEAIIFLQHPETAQPILLVSRTDSSFLYYYTTESQPRLLGHQNLAPHSNAWVAFTPSALALCPTDYRSTGRWLSERSVNLDEVLPNLVKCHTCPKSNRMVNGL